MARSRAELAAQGGGSGFKWKISGRADADAVFAIDSPEPGMSTARREPWLADAPSSFVSAVPTPGWPNGGP